MQDTTAYALKRKISLLAFFLCTGLVTFAYYAQYQWGIEPCPLCLIQRFFYFLLGLTFLGHTFWQAGFWLKLGILWSLFGLFTAGRQIILQHLPADQVPACGPGLDYMFSTFSSNEIFLELLHGSGECAIISWRFLGLSFAEWSFIGFTVSIGYAAWALYSKK